MEYKVKIPPGLETVDICNPPDNLEFLIRRTFFNFHQGTSKEYLFADKLRYIDCLVRNLKKLDPSTRRRTADLFVAHARHLWIEGDSSADILDIEFIDDCYNEGLHHASLYSGYTGSPALDKKIMQFLAEAVRLVMNYED